MRAVRVNKTKLTLGNAFIIVYFALLGKKESKYDKRTLFSNFSRRVDLSLNP